MMERTTVRLPEELLARARTKAATEGRTLTSLIEDGLRRVVAETRRGETRSLPRISAARGGLRDGISVDRFSDIQGLDDLEYAARIDRIP